MDKRKVISQTINSLLTIAGELDSSSHYDEADLLTKVAENLTRKAYNGVDFESSNPDIKAKTDAILKQISFNQEESKRLMQETGLNGRQDGPVKDLVNQNNDLWKQYHEVRNDPPSPQKGERGYYDDDYGRGEHM